MAREVTKIEQYGMNSAGDIRGFDCASGTKIPKGTILKLATPRTASASTGTADIFAGIASADKSGTDFSTRVGAWENGIYEFTASGTIVAGDKLQTATPGNYVMRMPSFTSHQIEVGYAVKSAATYERVQVRVNN